MPRTSFPALADIHKVGPVDPLATVDDLTSERAVVTFEHGADVVTVTVDRDNGTSLRVTVATTLTMRTDGIVPDGIVVRVNRLLAAEGLTLHRNWRTKGHGLRTGAGQVVWFGAQRAVTAERGASGWTLSTARGAIPAPSPKAPPKARHRAATHPGTFPAPSPEPVTAPEPEPITRPSGTEGRMNALVDVPAPEPEFVSSVSASDVDSLVVPPKYRGDIVVHDDVRRKFYSAVDSTLDGDLDVIALVGPSGGGKTHIAYKLASERKLPVVVFDASGVVEPGDWFGGYDAQLHFVPSDLLRALTAPGARVLIIDEANRAALRGTNAVLPILAGSGQVTIPQTGKRERVNPKVQIVLTCNMGAAFLGVEPLDEAIRTRVGTWIDIDHMGETEEAVLIRARYPKVSERDAANLARLGALVREGSKSSNGQYPPVSTRVLLSAARKIAKGLPARLAVDAAVLDGYDAESERPKVKTHVAGILWDTPKDAPKDGAQGALPEGVTVRVDPTTGKSTAVIAFVKGTDTE